MRTSGDKVIGGRNSRKKLSTQSTKLLYIQLFGESCIIPLMKMSCLSWNHFHNILCNTPPRNIYNFPENVWNTLMKINIFMTVHTLHRVPSQKYIFMRVCFAPSRKYTFTGGALIILSKMHLSHENLRFVVVILLMSNKFH